MNNKSGKLLAVIGEMVNWPFHLSPSKLFAAVKLQLLCAFAVIVASVRCVLIYEAIFMTTIMACHNSSQKYLLAFHPPSPGFSTGKIKALRKSFPLQNIFINHINHFNMKLIIDLEGVSSGRKSNINSINVKFIYRPGQNLKIIFTCQKKTIFHRRNLLFLKHILKYFFSRIASEKNKFSTNFKISDANIFLLLQKSSRNCFEHFFFRVFGEFKPRKSKTTAWSFQRSQTAFHQLVKFLSHHCRNRFQHESCLNIFAINNFLIMVSNFHLFSQKLFRKNN